MTRMLSKWTRHMLETESLNFAQFMLHWFIGLPEITEFIESSTPFRRKSNVFFIILDLSKCFHYEICWKHEMNSVMVSKYHRVHPVQMGLIQWWSVGTHGSTLCRWDEIDSVMVSKYPRGPPCADEMGSIQWWSVSTQGSTLCRWDWFSDGH